MSGILTRHGMRKSARRDWFPRGYQLLQPLGKGHLRLPLEKTRYTTDIGQSYLGIAASAREVNLIGRNQIGDFLDGGIGAASDIHDRAFDVTGIGGNVRLHDIGDVYEIPTL